MDTNNKQQEVSSYIGKLLRDNFGKGPESVYVSLNKSIITMYLRNFISPMESVLMARDAVQTVQQTRDMLMQSLIPEIKAYVKIVTGLEIQEFYYDWGFHNKSGIFVGICTEQFKAESFQIDNFPGKEEIHREIVNLSYQAQKVPQEVISTLLNPRTLIIIRNGILVSIEKELIRLGHRETLLIAKRNLEKKLLHNNSRFESILNTKIVDIFVDWDFNLDRSVIVFHINSTN